MYGGCQKKICEAEGGDEGVSESAAKAEAEGRVGTMARGEGREAKGEGGDWG